MQASKGEKYPTILPSYDNKWWTYTIIFKNNLSVIFHTQQMYLNIMSQ